MAMEQKQKPYSQRTLYKLYGFDAVAAACSSVLVSPFIAIVDRSIIENTNGKRTLSEGFKYGARQLIMEPHRFFFSKQFGLVSGLYFSTYMTANVIETTAEYHGIDSSRTSMLKFIGTTSVNMSLCIFKDRSFTQMFGTAAARRLPVLSYLLFALRDSLTVAASFNAPIYFSHYLQGKCASLKEKPDSALVVAQLACPAAVQFISTPLHLIALDLYNRPTASPKERQLLVKQQYLKSTFARIGRIGPAFGFGGIGNTYVRSYRSMFLNA
ncbi:hypothetical protein DM01DRAFT_1331869 [Hesseltinella vesiculosa]|uniref:Mitochondrial carrier n=1 Tax=Hesseltinella vesiculosa TaxID=101127 RepID=A0A1X2GWN1_9FUNG|nr:hypothetical protein DM01DRAFT_1331869 [Hesseltinella vesiculosa]